jgi:hypothetical protein
VAGISVRPVDQHPDARFQRTLEQQWWPRAGIGKAAKQGEQRRHIGRGAGRVIGGWRGCGGRHARCSGWCGRRFGPGRCIRWRRIQPATRLFCNRHIGPGAHQKGQRSGRIGSNRDGKGVWGKRHKRPKASVCPVWSSLCCAAIW